MFCMVITRDIVYWDVYTYSGFGEEDVGVAVPVSPMFVPVVVHGRECYKCPRIGPSCNLYRFTTKVLAFIALYKNLCQE